LGCWDLCGHADPRTVPPCSATPPTGALIPTPHGTILSNSEVAPRIRANGSTRHLPRAQGGGGGKEGLSTSTLDDQPPTMLHFAAPPRPSFSGGHRRPYRRRGRSHGGVGRRGRRGGAPDDAQPHTARPFGAGEGGEGGCRVMNLRGSGTRRLVSGQSSKVWE